MKTTKTHQIEIMLTLAGGILLGASIGYFVAMAQAAARVQEVLGQ